MKTISIIFFFITGLKLTAQTTAINDTLYIAVNDSVEVNLLKNDSGDSLKISSINLQGTAGIVFINEGDTVLTYIAPPGFTGNDSFIYEITDSPDYTSSAEVFINVLPGLSADYNTVSLYKFEEDQPGQSFDYSYNENHGIDEGTKIAEGVTGDCRYFDGIDDYINMDSVRVSLNPSSQWTIEFISKAAADTVTPPGLINHCCGNGWVLLPQRTRISYGVKTSGAGACSWIGNSWQYASTDLMDEQWHYYAAVYTANDSLRIYKDGIQVAAQFVTGIFQHTQGNNFKALIGWNDFSGGFDEGYMDEVRVSSVARSPEEIRSTFLLLNEYLGLPTTSVTGEDLNTPEGFTLHQNYPNPFNPTTKISWQSPISSWQTLKVYDVLGNVVAVLVDEYKPAGTYEVEFNAEGLASGIHFYRLQTGSFNQVKKMIMIK